MHVKCGDTVRGIFMFYVLYVNFMCSVVVNLFH